MQQVEHAFRTVDSQHPKYTVPRSAWVTPWFLALFALGAVGILLSMEQLTRPYTELMRLFAEVDGDVLTEPVTLGFRPFFVLSSAVLAIFVMASWFERIKLFVLSVGSSLAIMVLTDAFFLWIHFEFNGASPFSLLGNIVNAFAQLFMLTIVWLSSHHLPRTIDVPSERDRPLRYSVVLVLALACAITAAVLGITLGIEYVDWLRDHSVLGGLGPGLLLFAPAFQITLFVFAMLGRLLTKRQRRRRLLAVLTQEHQPSMAFLVPAHNEEETIADCLNSIGRAALNYSGPCAVYVVDNASTDRTSEVARETLARHPHLVGHVLYCGTPGKSNALNYGLARMQGEILVRVDSDTIVDEKALPFVAAHFSDPAVAGVGGLSLPLPNQQRTLFGRIRAIEVLVNVGAVRMGQGVIDSIMVLPGQLSAYRRELITRLGGFASGINGEDTELTVRVGRAGYRIVMDPDIRLYSEVPHSIPHLREQRIRWSRSLLHVYKVHLSALWYLQGWRGLWLLPMGLLSAIRRALVPLFILYAIMALIVAPDRLFIRDGMAVVAVIAGPHLVLVAAALVVYRRPGLVLFVPGYLALRLFRSYVAIEALLSMRHRSLVPTTEGVEPLFTEIGPAELDEEPRPAVASRPLAGSGNGRP